MATDATQAPAAPRVDVARALKDAGLAALIAFGLFLPLIGFKTVQNMRNELELETRLPLLFAFVALVAAASLLGSLVVKPWLERRAQREVLAAGSTWVATTARHASRLTAVGFWGVAIYFLGEMVLGLAGVSPPEDLETNPSPLSLAMRAAVVAVTGFVFYRLGDRPREGARPAARAHGLALLVIYPALVITLVGFQGALKWVDNFGIQILIYVMLGWGLNIVVGLAGLLDLGYVAFYAVGAYSYALLAKEFGLAFWILLPLAGILSAFWGILLGFPVLRLRGDYLAIVTLAFGEIIRLVLINWVSFTGGYAGVSGIPRPTFFGIPFNANEDGFAATVTNLIRTVGGWIGAGEESFWTTYVLEPSPVYRTIFLFYIILGLALVTAYVTVRLRRLPVGRAWEALREDEIACRSLGINTTNTKLTAFAMGAMFAGFAGSFFAARQGFISPESFTFMESAIILAIVVLGGMGSLIGVAIAAIAMIGGTEIMRELDFLKSIFGNDFDPTQYRMLLFGFAMVLIMVWKPRGLIATREPSAFLVERRAISGSLVKEGHG